MSFSSTLFRQATNPRAKCVLAGEEDKVLPIIMVITLQTGLWTSNKTMRAGSFWLKAFCVVGFLSLTSVDVGVF